MFCSVCAYVPQLGDVPCKLCKRINSEERKALMGGKTSEMKYDPREAEFARITLEFMRRVQLQGNEVPMFVEVNNWLQEKLENEVHRDTGTPEDKQAVQ